MACWAMSVSSVSTSGTVSPCSLRSAGRTSTARYSASNASDTTNGKAAASMPSRMRATGDMVLPVSRPATTTFVSTMAAGRLTTCAARLAHAEHVGLRGRSRPRRHPARCDVRVPHFGNARRQRDQADDVRDVHDAPADVPMTSGFCTTSAPQERRVLRCSTAHERTSGGRCGPVRPVLGRVIRLPPGCLEQLIQLIGGGPVDLLG